MDKNQAKELIKETFEKPFEKNKFTRFIKDLLNSYDETKKFNKSLTGTYIKGSFKDFIKSFDRIGRYHDGDNIIDILIVHLNRETSIERARTTQRNFIAGYLKGDYGSTSWKDAALVAFVSPNTYDWRFSLVKMDHRFEQNESGKIKVKEEFNPARRWSFLVGTHEKSHTAQVRFVPVLINEKNPTLTKLMEAFNIEIVTKEFFKEYRNLFLKTREALDTTIKSNSRAKADFESKEIDTVDFSKKLLGQIVFIYFLQKKGWFGVKANNKWGSGPKDFISQLFLKKYRDYNNFFDEILHTVPLGKIGDVKDGIIQGKVADKLFLKKPIDKKSKPLLFGEDISKFNINFNNNWVNYKPEDMMAIEVKRRGEGIRHGLWMRTSKIFERNKILTRQTADEIIAAYDTKNYYYSNTLHGTSITNSQYNPFYVLSILNSKLMTWYYRSTTAEEGKVFAQIKIELLKLLPIKKVRIAEQQPFITIVDNILSLTQSDDYLQNPVKQSQVKDYQAKIDEFVYNLYGLTDKEIKIVEGEKI